MARTFGANTSDRVQYTTTRLASNEMNLMAAWVYPTTLTNGRRFSGGSAGYGASITGTEITLFQGRSTTASQHVTSALQLAVNQWQFLCTLSSVGGSTGNPVWAVWRGTLDGGLQQVTVNLSVSGSGTPVASTTFVLGNTQGNSSAFQGDMENFVWLHCDAAVGATHPLFHGSAYGSLTANEIGTIQKRIVEPLFAGRSILPQYPWSSTGGVEQTLFTLDTANTAFQITRGYSSATVATPLTVTNTGTTLASRTSPQRAFTPFRSVGRVRR